MNDGSVLSYGLSGELLVPARTMTDHEIAAELDRRGREWVEFQEGLAEEGGMAGSPGEWMVERMSELETEQQRRLHAPDRIAMELTTQWNSRLTR